MIGTVAGHHLLCLSIGTQRVIDRLHSASRDWAKKGNGDCDVWMTVLEKFVTHTLRGVTSFVESLLAVQWLTRDVSKLF